MEKVTFSLGGETFHLLSDDVQRSKDSFLILDGLFNAVERDHPGISLSGGLLLAALNLLEGWHEQNAVRSSAALVETHEEKVIRRLLELLKDPIPR